MENTKRIHLLFSTEVEEIYSRPTFNAYEQRLYFTLSQPERTALFQHSNTKHVFISSCSWDTTIDFHKEYVAPYVKTLSFLNSRGAYDSGSLILFRYFQ